MLWSYFSRGQKNIELQLQALELLLTEVIRKLSLVEKLKKKYAHWVSIPFIVIIFLLS